ncbi:hypothetical protein LY625_04760 [Lysobacter sp. GX 14042]|uniref:hypothetical protein n=1 Tax=Lysobacter sp. GX 14042 TaxID=2907155 RepID=UPI001F19E714|nr:hypothetical protein [Lysobacter sp. GX 14042]MCE7031934.1 hypothetical protein [Lysobacter sp. GX 14042]
MKNRIWQAGIAAALATLCLGATAGEVDLSQGEPLQAQQAGVEKEFAANGRYAEIEPEQQQRARELLRRMGELVGEDGRAGALGQGRKVELFNLQEELNAILDRAAADSRLVCRRERHVGSNRPVNTCATVAERRRLREGGQEMFRSIRPAQPPPNQEF